jgi:hypothetical protein
MWQNKKGTALPGNAFVEVFSNFSRIMKKWPTSTSGNR